ncbi:MAG: hypothetical protein AAGF11_20570 [Myxococcota bacterium]
MAFYVTSRLRNVSPRTQRDAFEPHTMWLLGQPRVGRSMALIDPSGHSVITTKIERILSGPNPDSVYVRTRNSTYQLQQAQKQARPGLPKVRKLAPRSGR